MMKAGRTGLLAFSPLAAGEVRMMVTRLCFVHFLYQRACRYKNTEGGGWSSQREWLARHTHRPDAADTVGWGLCMTLEDLRLAREVKRKTWIPESPLWCLMMKQIDQPPCSLCCSRKRGAVGQ